MHATVHDNDLLDDLDAETNRLAYNAAFHELELDWHWDAITYACLPQGAAGVRQYIQQEHPHLLRAYDAEFLVNAVETAQRRCRSAMRERATNRRAG